MFPIPTTLPLIALPCLLVGCRCGEQPSQTRSSAAQPADSAPAVSAAHARRRPPIPVPKGTSLPILAGQGVGPVRIGATVATIERLMGLPCEHKTESLCAYPSRAVEFWLEDGKTVRIHAHRAFRHPAFARDQVFGAFNGGFTNGVRFGMHRHYAAPKFGEPTKQETVAPPELRGAEYVTVERHHYPGLILEYDLLENGNTVLGGVIVTKAGEGPVPSSNAAPTKGE